MSTAKTLFLETAEIRSYAQRSVNPFLGVLQVIETDGGRATSSNGVVWNIDLRTDRANSWDSIGKGSQQAVYYRYGLWSAEDGLVNRPLAQLQADDPLMLQCEKLIICIQQRLQHLPFQLIDDRELWLFDKNDQLPIALLATALIDAELPSPTAKYWKSFLGAEGLPCQRRYPAARELEEQVQQAASFNILRHWVTRHDDGSGIVDGTGVCLQKTDFPVYLLTEHWPDPVQAKRASDYIEWISPSLLTLQHLQYEERERLENCLKIQAVSIEYHWHLYPVFHDETKIKAARVQALLQKSK